MRLLVVSNYFPPFFFGGYELGCNDVVERLRARGHEVTVLTSDHRAEEEAPQADVWRTLTVDDGQRFRPLWHLRSVVGFLRALRTVGPTAVYFWNQAGLSLWLSPVARLLGTKRVFFLSDTSFTSWKVGAFLRRSPQGNRRGSRHWLHHGWSILRGAHCQFASEFLRRLSLGDRAASVDDVVIHWGIDAANFPLALERREADDVFKILYVGQIIPEKGVHTLIEAAALLVQEIGAESFVLNLVGGSSKPDYLSDLHDKVGRLGLQGQVHFVGKVPREDLPALYRAHDVLVMPSIWDEPFAITPLEAMASGIPVVATMTGGSPEIFRDRENALTFPAGDAVSCAAALVKLRSNGALAESIAAQAAEMVRSQFTIERMVDEIEDDLMRNT